MSEERRSRLSESFFERRRRRPKDVVEKRKKGKLALSRKISRSGKECFVSSSYYAKGHKRVFFFYGDLNFNCLQNTEEKRNKIIVSPPWPMF